MKKNKEKTRRIVLSWRGFRGVSFAGLPTLDSPTSSSVGTLTQFMKVLIEIVQFVAIPALTICIIYAGYMIVTAGGDEKKLASGKMWVYGTVIGATIILGASVLADMVLNTASSFL